MTVEIGSAAPEFSLRNQHGQTVSLADFRGTKNVLLMFYPFAFTGTCTGELCTIRDRYTDFVNDETEVLSVSCDSVHTLRVFAEQERLQHSLVSDFWPHGATATAYGAFNEAIGAANRASFVIDREGIVRWSVVTGLGEARSADDYLAALAAL
jgi:peroxiredoxin